jgi:hypothetical protein
VRYFFDTEFIEDSKTIDLISIGIVAEDRRELYLESAEAQLTRANAWVKEHVLPHLEYNQGKPAYFRRVMRQSIQDFCDPEKYGKPEFWGYYADYDWVALCQLFGTMMDLPKGWPRYCRDIKQEADRKEADARIKHPEFKLWLPEQGKGEHHALADARWNRKAWEYVKSFTGVFVSAKI